MDRHRDKIKLFFLPPYVPESNPDEYLNHALKLSVHSGDLTQSKCDIRHKTASFMQTLQYSPDKVSAFFNINRFPIFLFGSNLDRTDGEQLLLWEELRLITDKLADAQERIAYLS